MNYRHAYHAGNFADVLKHVLLLRLVDFLQRKPGGVLFVDTHAGRGGYDLEEAARGDTLEREPEWPAGIGRLWAGGVDGERGEGGASAPAGPAGAQSPIADYLGLVGKFNGERGAGRSAGPAGASLLHYPGSPVLLAAKARPQDRLEFWERHPGECGALRQAVGWRERTGVHEGDGYGAIRACLPPPERRALVLIDPPYEQPGEHEAVGGAVREALRRLPSAVLAIWYPLTARAAAGQVEEVLRRAGRPSLTAELMADAQGAGLRGCGLAVVNPPWQFDAEAEKLTSMLGRRLGRGPGSGGCVRWISGEAPGGGRP